MNIFKKLFIPTKQKNQLKSYKSWVVRWKSRQGEFQSNTQNECEIFTTKKDAVLFANQLKNAFKLIRHSSGNEVTVYKN